jgi:hypothetical protein
MYGLGEAEDPKEYFTSATARSYWIKAHTTAPQTTGVENNCIDQEMRLADSIHLSKSAVALIICSGFSDVTIPLDEADRNEVVMTDSAGLSKGSAASNTRAKRTLSKVRVA